MGGSMFSDVSSTEPEEKVEKKKTKLSFKGKSSKPEKKVKPKEKKKKVEKPAAKPNKKSTKNLLKNSSKSKSSTVRVYSYFRNELFNPDGLEIKPSRYLKSLIRLVSRKNGSGSVVLHRTDDLMREIDDIVLDLEFDISDELITDNETYVNANEGINVI